MVGAAWDGAPESESVDKIRRLRIDDCYNYNLPILVIIIME